MGDIVNRQIDNTQCPEARWQIARDKYPDAECVKFLVSLAPLMSFYRLFFRTQLLTLITDTAFNLYIFFMEFMGFISLRWYNTTVAESLFLASHFQHLSTLQAIFLIRHSYRGILFMQHFSNDHNSPGNSHHLLKSLNMPGSKSKRCLEFGSRFCSKVGIIRLLLKI